MAAYIAFILQSIGLFIVFLKSKHTLFLKFPLEGFIFINIFDACYVVAGATLGTIFYRLAEDQHEAANINEKFELLVEDDPVVNASLETSING